MVCIDGLPWALPKAKDECCAVGATHTTPALRARLVLRAELFLRARRFFFETSAHNLRRRGVNPRIGRGLIRNSEKYLKRLDGVAACVRNAPFYWARRPGHGVTEMIAHLNPGGGTRHASARSQESHHRLVTAIITHAKRTLSSARRRGREKGQLPRSS